jgi:hypothetical protein
MLATLHCTVLVSLFMLPANAVYAVLHAAGKESLSLLTNS